MRLRIWLGVAAVVVSGCTPHRVVADPTPAPTTGPTTVAQLCDAQTWPRPVPQVVGRLLYQAKDGALECWDHLKAVAPDGHDPLHAPARPAEKTYRITAVSPASGTPVGRHDVVTVELAEIGPAEAAGFKPCDWVTTSEAAAILGGPVTALPFGGQTGSVDIACIYESRGDVGQGVEVDLRTTGAFAVDAASQFELATRSGHFTPVTGVGVKAGCVEELTTTPPSTTLVVLLDGDRLLRVTQGFGSCGTLKRFAQLAIPRVG